MAKRRKSNMTLEQYKLKLKTIIEAKHNLPAIDFQVFVIQVSNDMKVICESQLKLITALESIGCMCILPCDCIEDAEQTSKEVLDDLVRGEG